MKRTMEEIIDLTKNLIRFKTTQSRIQEIRRCAEFIENYLKNCNVAYQRFDHQNIPSILVGPHSNFVPILLLTHIDVVDAPDELFNPLEKDEKLYGRGSIDDKYAVALSLVLVKKHMQQLRRKGKGQDALPFGVLITSDEEIGGFYGAKKVLRDIKTDFCVVLDGGSVEKIVVKERGVVRVKLISRVNSVHGSTPWQSDNAVETLINDYLKLRTFFVQSAPEHWHRAVTIHSLVAEESDNQLQGFAEASLLLRYTENDKMEELIDKMNTELHSEIIVESITPIFDKGRSSYLDLLMGIAKNTAFGFEDGSNDARFLSDFGINGIVWGADGGQSRHSLDEHVQVKSVFTLYGILNEFIEKSQNLQSATRNTSLHSKEYDDNMESPTVSQRPPAKREA